MLPEPKIIFENDDFVVIDKPAGLMVHAARISAAKIKRNKVIERSQDPTLTDWLVKRWPAMATVGDDPMLRPGIVHRLDKGTSGVMIVAKTQASFEKLKKLFQSHKMKKTYVALVVGIPEKEKGIIDHPIGIKNGTLKRSIHAATMAKPAVTEYEVKEKYQSADAAALGESFALLEVRPQTGRTHQIRVHLASIGHPIVGDPLYGSHRSGAQHKNTAIPFVDVPRLMLHAQALEFADGAGNRFAFEAPLPHDFMEVIHRVAHNTPEHMVE
jgi:23S rRNA pseudouridine1911/1915/1917 synthase